MDTHHKDNQGMDARMLKFLNLNDSYERKARFFPALLTGLVLAPLFLMVGLTVEKWSTALPSTLAISALIVGVSHLASAAGNRIQQKLYPRWPYDSPTHLWLYPTDPTCSRQQKERWYNSIKLVTGLDIREALSDQLELERVINDSNRQLRAIFSRLPKGEQLARYNSDYGFARNLTGLRLVWLTFAAISCAGCWLIYSTNASEQPGVPILATSVLAVSIATAIILPDYVRVTARHYADYFYATLDDVAQDTTLTKKTNEEPTNKSGASGRIENQ